MNDVVGPSLNRVMCVDGVEREDTHEQAELRLEQPKGRQDPAKFSYRGVPYGGNRRGFKNLLSRRMREALLKAAEIEGRMYSDAKPDVAEAAEHMSELFPEAPADLVAYFVKLSRSDEKAFAGLLGKLLPNQITGEDGGPVQVQYRTRRELIAAFLKFGLEPPERLRVAFEQSPDAPLRTIDDSRTIENDPATQPIDHA